MTNALRIVSSSTVRPPAHPRSTVHLTPWDLSMLTIHYIQSGLLYGDLPPSVSVSEIVDRLKSSLSAVLLHFYPLAGQLVVAEEPAADGSGTSVSISIDCSGRGAEFVHAVADGVSVADALAPGADVPDIVREFFPLNGAINYDGGASAPLFAVQVTELTNGVFIGWAFNHLVADGASVWHFINTWAEISRNTAAAAADDADGGALVAVSRPPINERWFLDGFGDRLPLKTTFAGPFLERNAYPPVKERMFHFSGSSIAALKATAAQELAKDGKKVIVTTFLALVSLVWRCVERARRSPPETVTSCSLAISARGGRVQPPVSVDYFGNVMTIISSEAVTVGELLSRGHGWAVAAVARAVSEHTDGAVKTELRAWETNPKVFKLSEFGSRGVVIASSPRFDVYGCDFGWGKPVAPRTGEGNKYDGCVSLWPGKEGGGSVDVELDLLPDAMDALLKDEEFIAFVTAE